MRGRSWRRVTEAKFPPWSWGQVRKQVSTGEEVWEAWVCPGGLGAGAGRTRPQRVGEEGGWGREGGSPRVRSGWGPGFVALPAARWVRRGTGEGRLGRGGRSLSSCLLLETENPAAFLALAQSVSIWGCARAAGHRVAGGQAPPDGTVRLGRADSGFGVQEIPGLGGEASSRAERRARCFYTRESAPPGRSPASCSNS